MNIMGPLEAWALEVIRRQRGFDAAKGPDGVIRLEGVTRPIALEMKRRVDSPAARAVVAHAGAAENVLPLLLVAEWTTGPAREVLEQGGVAFVDGLGNSVIRLPGVFVRAGAADEASAPGRRYPARARLAGKAGVVAQALLLDREREWKVEQASVRCEVSRGLVHRVFARLEALHILEASGAGPKKSRRVVDAAALLDLWAEEEKESGANRRAAYVLAPSGPQGAVKLSGLLQQAAIDHAVSGVAAAALRAPFLTSVPVTEVRVTAAVPMPAVLAAMGARPVEEGANVVVVQTSDDLALRFRSERDSVWVAADTRIYLDALRDPRRGSEQAQVFRETVLGIGQ
ncbi:MAG: hypothetical protein ACYC33_09390 [Thermoleophilia bacterium]